MSERYYISDSDPTTKSNMGCIETDRGIYYFDTSYSAVFFEKLLIGVVDKDKRITLILSHKHIDHYNGLSTFARNHIDRIIASDEFNDELGHMRSLQVLNKSERNLENGMKVFLILNAHTTKDIILCDFRSKVAFMGDLLLEKRHPLLDGQQLSVRYDVYVKLLKMGINKFIPGHGRIISDVELYGYLEYFNFVKACQNKYFEKTELDVEEILRSSIYANWKYPETFIRNITQKGTID